MPTITNSGMPMTITGGGIESSAYIPIYTFGITGELGKSNIDNSYNGRPLYISGGTGSGMLAVDGYIPMVIPDTSPTGSLSLIINPPDSVFESPVFSLFIRGGTYTGTTNYIPSFIKVDDQETKYNTFPLYISTNETVYESIPMFVQVNYGSGDIPVYIRGIGYKLINNGPFDNSGYIPFMETLDLFINRIEASEIIPLFLKATDDTAFATIPVSLSGVEGLQTASIPLAFFDQDETLSVPLYIRGRL